MNIREYFQEETTQFLADKRLRIICLTHEERVSGFAQKSLNLQGPVRKGQMLEIKPRQIIDSTVLSQVTLFGREKDEQDIIKNFKINLQTT